MNDNMLNSKIKIAYDNDFTNRLYDVTPAQVKLLKEISIKVLGKIDKVFIRKLEKLSKANPNLPQLKNFITVAYIKIGFVEKSLAVNNEILQEFPDYLHARMNAANHYIHINELDTALLYLGENLDISSAFPNRSEFHFSEVQAYYFSTVLFAISKRDLPLAENRLAVYKAIDEENPNIEQLETMVENLRFNLGFDAYEDFLEITENVPPVTDRTSPPEFNHPEIHQLYQIGFQNSLSVLEEILALPRQSLIEDLELVLQDAIERYPYFLKEDLSADNDCFALHALFLLMELRATESLQPVLNFFQYNEAFLEFYIGDFLTDEIWQAAYYLGKDQISLLKAFLKLPGVYSFSKSMFSNVLLQILKLEPQRREEIEQVFSEVLSFFIHAKPEDNVIDFTFIGLMIGDIGLAKMTNLFPLIKELYDLEYVDLSIEGDYDNFVANTNSDENYFGEYSIQTLSEIYNGANVYEVSPDYSAEDTAYFKALHYEPKVIQMVPEKTVKVNRNDPCPCGSGTKYKKCCGK